MLFEVGQNMTTFYDCKMEEEHYCTLPVLFCFSTLGPCFKLNQGVCVSVSSVPVFSLFLYYLYSPQLFLEVQKLPESFPTANSLRRFIGTEAEKQAAVSIFSPTLRALLIPR